MNQIVADIRVRVAEQFTKQLCETDCYGNPKTGKLLTLTELIVEKGKEWLNETVDASGCATTYGGKERRFEFFARKAANDFLGTAIAKELEAAKNSMHTKICAAMAETVSKMVKSAASAL